MEDYVKKFIKDFHALEGVTTGEKKRSLFQLLNNATIFQENKSLLDELSSHLKPETHLERIFFIELLIYFRQYDTLAVEFFKGDEIIISRINHEKWFFQTAFEKIGNEFVSQILPTLSYSLKLKLLKKMTTFLNESQGDEIFDAILDTYGLDLATNVLLSCSISKIESTLRTHPIKLWPNQLKLLYNKSPTLICVYLEERVSHEGNTAFMDSNPIFEYIAQKDVEMYYELHKKYNFKIKLGKRVTKKYISVKRNEIIAHPELHVKNLNPGRLIHKLGPDFKQVYTRLFPRTIEESPNSESTRLLKYYPKKGQYNLMVVTFNQIFDKRLQDSPHLIDEFILKLIPDPVEREKLAKTKQGDDPDSYIKYYQPTNCLKIIQEKINFARLPYERTNLLRTLVECCLINHDYEALLQVLKFATDRLKNDYPEVQGSFLPSLIWNKCDFNQLRSDHWTLINKIIARNDFSIYKYDTIHVFYQYLEFLIKTDQGISEQIVNFFKKQHFDPQNMTFFHSPKAKKIFLETFLEVAPLVASKDQSIESLDCKLLQACQKFNSQYRRTCVSCEFPRLIKSTITILGSGKTESGIDLALQVLVCSQNKSEEFEELRKIFWEKMDDVSPFVCRWFLQYRPDFILKYLNRFHLLFLKNFKLLKNKQLLNLIKTCNLDIQQKLIESCYSNLDNNNTPLLLSHLMKPQDFIKLVESYKPISFTIDLENSEMSARFKIQKAFVIGLKNTNLPLETLLLILQFLEGDFIPLCLSPLYKSFYKSPENQLETYCNEIKSRNHVKKHAYYFFSSLFTKKIAEDNLQQCQLKQSLTICFKYFLRNPSQQSWELFTSKLCYFNKNDEAVLKLLTHKIIPKEFKVLHFQTVWELCDDKHKKILMRNIQKDSVLELRPEFWTKFNFFQNGEINRIVSEYIIFNKSGRELDICNFIQQYKISTGFSAKAITDFVSSFFGIYMQIEDHDEDLIDSFFSKFKKVFTINEAFEEYVMFTLMKSKNCDLVSTIIDLHNEMIVKYTEIVTELIANTIKKHLEKFLKTNQELYKFYYSLLSKKKSNEDALLVIKLLPTDSQPQDKESCMYFERTLSHLQELSLASVQLHLNLYFKNRKIVTASYYERVNRFGINTSSWLQQGARRRVGYVYY